jgi:hypothetical protein
LTNNYNKSYTQQGEDEHYKERGKKPTTTKVIKAGSIEGSKVIN